MDNIQELYVTKEQVEIVKNLIDNLEYLKSSNSNERWCQCNTKDYTYSIKVEDSSVNGKYKITCVKVK